MVDFFAGTYFTSFISNNGVTPYLITGPVVFIVSLGFLPIVVVLA
jgi:hypothetical protein